MLNAGLLGQLWACSRYSGNARHLTGAKKQKTPTAALALEILLLVLREQGCGELGRAQSEGGRREALPQNGHAVWGLLAGSLAHPASSGWVHGTWRPASPLPAWHGGLLGGGRPPFPVAGVVSLSQCGGVGFRGGHLPGVQAGPVRQSILGSWRLRRGEARSSSSSPAGELGSPGGALEASAGHHPDKLCEGTGRGGEKTAQSGPLRLPPPNLQISLGSECPPPASIATAPARGWPPPAIQPLPIHLVHSSWWGAVSSTQLTPLKPLRAPHGKMSNILLPAARLSLLGPQLTSLSRLTPPSLCSDHPDLPRGAAGTLTLPPPLSSPASCLPSLLFLLTRRDCLQQF